MVGSSPKAFRSCSFSQIFGLFIKFWTQDLLQEGISPAMIVCMNHVKGLLDRSAVVLTAQDSGTPCEPIVQPAVICGQPIHFLCDSVKKYADPITTLLRATTAEHQAFAAAAPSCDPTEGHKSEDAS